MGLWPLIVDNNRLKHIPSGPEYHKHETRPKHRFYLLFIWHLLIDLFLKLLIQFVFQCFCLTYLSPLITLENLLKNLILKLIRLKPKLLTFPHTFYDAQTDVVLFSTSKIAKHFISFLNLVEFIIITLVVVRMVDFGEFPEFLFYLL